MQLYQLNYEEFVLFHMTFISFILQLLQIDIWQTADILLQDYNLLHILAIDLWIKS